MQMIRVGAVEEFEDRSKRVVTVGNAEIGVFRLGDDSTPGAMSARIRADRCVRVGSIPWSARTSMIR